MILGRAGSRICASSLVISSLGLCAGHARAAPLNVSLSYAAGAGCPDAADFEAVVIARLGYDPFVEGAPDHVLVEVGPKANALSGRIEWRDASGDWTGDQTFPSVNADCQRLVRVMGFALAVQIQLLARTSAPPPEAPGAPAIDKPPVTLPPPAASTVTAAADLSPPPASHPRPALAVGAGPSVGVGLSSTPVLLGRLFGALAWQHLSVELGAAASLPSTTRRADGAGFSQQHLLGSGAACAVVTRWNACLVANAGAVRMTGENIDRTNSASVFLAEVGARVGLDQPIGRRARLGAHADGLINLTRWTGSLDQVPVWTAPRFAAALGIDVSVLFP